MNEDGCCLTSPVVFETIGEESLAAFPTTLAGRISTVRRAEERMTIPPRFVLSV